MASDPKIDNSPTTTETSAPDTADTSSSKTESTASTEKSSPKTESSAPAKTDKAPTDAKTESSSSEAGAPAKTSASTQSPSDKKQERFELINLILGKETFIDPLIPETITKAYAFFESDPSKMLIVMTGSFQAHCRKCIREAALIEKKNEISIATLDEAEHLKTELAERLYRRIKADVELEQLLMLLIFKNSYWNWLRHGLKDIFIEQRNLPGNSLNTDLNSRFHKLKATKGYRVIGDLLSADIVEIVNRFKNEVVGKKNQNICITQQVEVLGLRVILASE